MRGRGGPRLHVWVRWACRCGVQAVRIIHALGCTISYCTYSTCTHECTFSSQHTHTPVAGRTKEAASTSASVRGPKTTTLAFWQCLGTCSRVRVMSGAAATRSRLVWPGEWREGRRGRVRVWPGGREGGRLAYIIIINSSPSKSSKGVRELLPIPPMVIRPGLAYISQGLGGGRA